MRHYVPRNLLIEYYKSNVNPIIQYGIIVYGCCSFSSLQPILRLQKKILKFTYFRKKYSNSEDIFVRNKLLTVYEFHIYELLKFVLRSVNNLHSESMLNNLFSFETSRNTRISSLSLINEQCWKQKRQRQSIINRATKLFNTLRTNSVLPNNVEGLSCKEISKIYHEIKTSYILNNPELVSHIFKS